MALSPGIQHGLNGMAHHGEGGPLGWAALHASTAQLLEHIRAGGVELAKAWVGRVGSVWLPDPGRLAGVHLPAGGRPKGQGLRVNGGGLAWVM